MASLFLVPGVHGRAGPVFNEGWHECGDWAAQPVPCYLYALSNLTVGDCDGARCPFRVETGAYGTAHLPSLLYVSTEVVISGGGGGSACLGPKSLRDQHGAVFGAEACGQVCESFNVGLSVFCEGETARDVALPVGACTEVSVFSYMTWGYVAEGNSVLLMYDVCRTGEDSFDVTPWVWR